MIKDVPIPKKMKALAKDVRGYPIPYVILRDSRGCPHFAANDSLRQRKALLENRCPICGTSLRRPLWFVGGPLSAFHEHGTYIDSAMHYECMEYALKVCPYLSAPQYLGHVDPEKIAKKMDDTGRLYVDPTTIPGRPRVLVAVASRSQAIHSAPYGLGPLYVTPVRPYLKIEYWRNGVKLEDEEGQREAQRVLQEAKAKVTV